MIACIRYFIKYAGVVCDTRDTPRTHLAYSASHQDHAHVQLALGHKTRLLAVPVLSELLLCACVAKQLSTFVVGYSAIQVS